MNAFKEMVEWINIMVYSMSAKHNIWGVSASNEHIENTTTGFLTAVCSLFHFAFKTETETIWEL